MKKKSYFTVDKHEPVHSKHLEVTSAQCAGDVEKMIRKFTKKVKMEGVLQEYSERQHFARKQKRRKLKKEPEMAVNKR